jgi:hypothetical protein
LKFVDFYIIVTALLIQIHFFMEQTAPDAAEELLLLSS